MVHVDVTSAAVIERPRDAVARFAGDPGNAPRWYTNIGSVRWRTPPPLAVGSQLEFAARFLRRKLVYTYEVRELVEGDRLVMRTADGPFPMETTYTWVDSGPSSTRMTLRNRGAPKGFSHLVAPFMSLAVRRANRKDLARLKAMLESG